MHMEGASTPSVPLGAFSCGPPCTFFSAAAEKYPPIARNKTPRVPPLRSLNSIPLHSNPLTFTLGRKSYTSIPGYYFSYAQTLFHASNPHPATAIMNGTTTNGNGHLNANKVRLYQPNSIMTRLHTDQSNRTHFCSLQRAWVKAIQTRSGEYNPAIAPLSFGRNNSLTVPPLQRSSLRCHPRCMPEGGPPLQGCLRDRSQDRHDHGLR